EGDTAKQFGDDALIKGRSINEGEAAAERISNDSEEIVRVLTSIDAATVLAGGIDVPTGSGSIPTATVISTGSEVGPTTSPIATKRKGKEVMVESDTPKKKKLQEQIDAQGTGNSFTYDLIPESFDEVSPNPPPQFHFNIYLCQLCESNSHYGYEDCGVLPEADHCQTLQYTVNHPIFNAHNDLLSSQTTLMEQMTQLTSMCEMACQIIQKKQKEKRIEKEQAAKAQNSKILACCDDDDDYNFAITPNEPVDSLSMGDEHLNTIPATESNEFIKSCVENLVPNPSESEGENGCDVLASFTTFSNILFDAEYKFDSVDDQSLSDEDVSEKIFSNPLFEEEIIPMKIDHHHHNTESDLIESMLNHDSSIIPSSLKIDSLLDEFAGELTLLKSISPGIDKTDCHPENEIRIIERLFDSRMEDIDLTFTPDDPMPPSIEDDNNDSERDILILEELPSNYSLSLPENESFHFDIPSFSRPPAKPPDGNTGILNIKMMGDVFDQKVPIPGLTITHVPNREKSPDLLSHRSHENFQLSAKCPMMIHGKNIPILDVPLFYFYPP
nr:hypothetical protein [Tanacetum cinerariifolium]